jgi:enoyl-[acyl-carrier-protein] reductase (NADH)
MQDVVETTRFLLDNKGISGQHLYVDRGTALI